MDNTQHRADIIGDKLLHEGRTYAGTDQVGKLCRELKQGTLHLYRDGRITMSGDVSKRAELSLTDNDKNLRYVKYKEFPKDAFIYQETSEV